MNKFVTLLIITLIVSCQTPQETQPHVVTSDIDRFWEAYDRIIQETDTLKQLRLMDSLYIKKGTPGLQKIMEVRNYTAEEYVKLIHKYPKYWNSIRENTLKSKTLASELEDGIEKLRTVYPDLKPAKIFFTIGAMRTNGTIQDSLVLIGSELAMADNNIDISEFEGRTKEWLETYFGTNPMKGLVLLNVHEYVHTQQKPIPDNLLHQVLYEGVAEFVSVKAMDVPSSTPAIEFGKTHPKVKQEFEKEMFYERTYEWMWSNAINEFGVRDLGYYIGYEIAEKYYENAADKLKSIKELIELDYNNPSTIDAFIDQTCYFSKPIAVLRKEDGENRPKVSGIKQFENGAQNVDSGIKEITITFSEKLNGHNTGVDFGALGESTFPKVSHRFWSEDAKSWTLQVALEPRKRYQFLITGNFRTTDDVPLLPYVVDFKTRDE